MLKKINWIHIAIFILAALIFSLISFPNHYYFRSENLDYGMLNHALANFSEFKTNTFTCTPYDRDNHFLADHFSPIMYVYIPFFYIFQDYALLVVQIVTILIGGWGVLKLSSLYFSKKGIQSIILFHFFPIIDDAEYIVLLKGNNYPLNLQEYTQKIDELLISKEFETLYNNNEFYVFKKR